ncbi:response regulator transcription factor [Paraburkholderia sediminicola]|uniref:winged helix-turn-helix domain-containing protein n=1 Tax=Paraburkholderia sediminicola TaxID=458836 RepID=UPI0038B742DD
MQIALLTRNDSTFRRIKGAFEADGAPDCVRYTDELGLIRSLERSPPDLVIIESATEFSASNLVLAWRACHFRQDLPVMMIGQWWDSVSMTNALHAGVDEIVVGELRLEEIVARGRHAVESRRGTSAAQSFITLGSSTLYRTTREFVTVDRRVRLTAREFIIAWLFFSNPGALITRKELAHAVWGKELDIAVRSLEQHIYKLRAKLEFDELTGLKLRTVYSLGYMLEQIQTPHHRNICATRMRVMEAVS